MTIFLMLPGSPLPDWLILLFPLALLLLFIQCWQWIHKWYKNRLVMQHNSESLPHHEIVVEDSNTEI